MSSGSTHYKSKSNIMQALERQMKDLWLQYVNRLDQEGLTDGVVALRKRYYDLYRSYRQHRDWKNLVNEE